MPSFIAKDGRHFVAYVTGPSHVLLGVRFVEHPAEPKLVKEAPQGTCSHSPLDELQVREAVQEALAAFRAEAGANLHAAEIVYVENDSPHYDLFRIAAQLLAKHYVSGAEFKRVA
ncbi:hypothetical protein [Piscinibacter terrae]|uniref:hypothetical protein n=1 Tax=Piscinibacter terrae TaxID=2496871 RepID=UPI000F5AD114|nr:hypothetical protein [Albitalea terrae]